MELCLVQYRGPINGGDSPIEWIDLSRFREPTLELESKGDFSMTTNAINHTVRDILQFGKTVPGDIYRYHNCTDSEPCSGERLDSNLRIIETISKLNETEFHSDLCQIPDLS
jgi:hypothetical protein